MTETREQFRPGDHPNDHFLLTSVVGSYKKPAWLDELREQWTDPESDVDADDWTEATDDAARLITQEHERAGLDVVVDGEMRRNEMVEYFYHRMEGVEFPGKVKVWGHNYFDKPAVIDAVSRSEPWLLDEYEFTSSVADRPVKVPITGPYTLARWAFNEYYDSTAELAYELADLVNDEVARLIEAGARYVQIDEPALAQHEDDHAIVGECLDRITDEIPDNVRVGLHVCYGDYSRIYPELLEFPIDEFDVETANHGFEQLEVFREPAFTKDLALGVVDAHDAEVESVETIRDRIEEGLRVVPPERLTISPDCGLKLLPRPVAYQKMENMVKAAREVEAALDEGSVQVGAPTPQAD